MSKIGKKPIKIPEGVTCEIGSGEIKLKGKKGELTIKILPWVKAEKEQNELRISPLKETKQAKSNWGTLRSIVANAFEGITQGFEKTLILEGVGYRATKEGENLTLTLGFSYPVKYAAPEGINFEVEKNSIIKIQGFDKALVGQVAAEIRSLKKPEPYKGKGFHYSNEIVRRKAGKKAATTSGATA